MNTGRREAQFSKEWKIFHKILEQINQKINSKTAIRSQAKNLFSHMTTIFLALHSRSESAHKFSVVRTLLLPLLQIICDNYIFFSVAF